MDIVMLQIKPIMMGILLFAGTAYGQVQGLSAGKLSVPNTSTVPQFAIEFEPSFSFGFSTKHWNEAGWTAHSFQRGDSISVASELNFRFTYGVQDNLEIGTSMPSNLHSFGVGTKFRFWEITGNSAAIIAGVNFPLGNKNYSTVSNDASAEHFSPAVAIGGIFTHDFSDADSWDFTIHRQYHLTSGSSSDTYIFSEFGKYLTPDFQVCGGIIYENHSFGNSDNQHKLAANAGVTIEYAKSFIIVLNTPIDLFGKNMEKSIGFSFALTILFE